MCFFQPDDLFSNQKYKESSIIAIVLRLADFYNMDCKRFRVDRIHSIDCKRDVYIPKEARHEAERIAT